MKTYIISFVFLLLNFTALIAKEIPSLPSPSRLVNDYSGTLTQEEIQALESKLVKYTDSTSTQITVVMESSIEGEEVFDYSMRIAQAWGIGQKGKNNGVLIYVAIQERKVRIQVGYGLEAVLTDAVCKSIIEQVIKPKFKQGQYFAGLYEASDYIIGYAKGEFKGEPKSNGGKKKSWSILFFVIILVLFVLSRLKGGGGSNYGSGGGMDWWTAAMLGSALSRGSGRSYGDFSSGSGSFGGFGGGSFGGGGAGGDW